MWKRCAPASVWTAWTCRVGFGSLAGDGGDNPQMHLRAVPRRPPWPATVSQSRDAAVDEPATPGPHGVHAERQHPGDRRVGHAIGGS
jgi:hypothetical protein